MLTVILHNLLFKPVLKVLDERKEKIRLAEEKEAEIARLTAENQKELENLKAQARQKKSELAKAELAEIQSRGKIQADQARRQCLADVRQYRESITEEYDRIVSGVAPEMETAAAIFAKNIINHRI